MSEQFDPLGGAHEIREWTNVSEADGITYEGFSCSCGAFGYAPQGTPDAAPGLGGARTRGSVRQQIEWHLNVARAIVGLGLDTPHGRDLLSDTPRRSRRGPL